MPKMQSNGVQVVNKAGVYKKFKDVNSPNAISWAWSHHLTDPDAVAKKPKRVKMTDEEKAQKRKEKTELKNKFDRWLYEKAQDAFAYAMDGGDPIDSLSGVFKKNNLTMDDVDRVLRRFDRTNKGFYQILAQMWDDMQGDRIYDAEHGHIEDNNQFYRVEDGKVIPQDNPWK